MKNLVVLLTCFLFPIASLADTFTHRSSGDIFRGYATQKKRGNKTLVRIDNKQNPEYLDLAEYDIEWNPSGRRNEVIILPIKTDVKLECETAAFEKAIEIASNRGPLFILIEIDTPGGRVDLMERICAAITKTDNCRTVAFVSGGEYGGAYSAGAIIALACDYIYMADNTAIGAATTILASDSGVTDLKSALGETVGEKFLSAERAYVAALAEQNGRPGLLAQAMVDKDIEVWEVAEDGNTVFITPENKKDEQSVLRVWSKKGSLLTLTAMEAAQCGMADKIVGQMDEVISDFGSERPRLIRNEDTNKARREFESAERKLKKIYDDIDRLRKEADSLLAQFNSVTDYYNREVNRLNELIRHTDRRYHNAIESQEELLKEISSRRDNLKPALLRVLRRLSSEYKTAIPLGKSYSDLQVDVEGLNKEINSIDVLCRSIK